jgi:thiamine-monophosphate kinase
MPCSTGWRSGSVQRISGDEHLPRPSEDALIARYFAPLATHAGADGLRDDAALFVPPSGGSLVLTADALVAGVHFLPDDPPEMIARKALRVNLSDLAAKGARPAAFLLALALPPDWEEDWLAAFAKGLGEDCATFGTSLIGGDTVGTPGPVTVVVTALGLVPGHEIPRRKGARPGDGLYVSGTIGDGALGLLVGRGDDRLIGAPQAEAQFLLSRYRLPEPRLALAPAVLAHASAAMDVSDGLVGDLAKLLAASGASAEVELEAIPLSDPVRLAVAADPELHDVALTGGDDYEILCAVPPSESAAFEAMAAASGVPVARIGVVASGAKPTVFLDATGHARHFERGSFSHFR